MTTAERNVKVNGDRQVVNLVSLVERYADEGKARAFLEKLRWPNGVRCPRCDSGKVSTVRALVGKERIDRQTGEVKRPSRNQFDCDSCRYQFSVTSGTTFHDTHLPLWKWFLAVYLMGEARKGVSANQLKRTLGVSYKTAWYLCHRIRWAMGLTDDGEPLGDDGGIVEADETYVGGKAKGHARAFRNKTMVMGALERGGNVRLKVGARTSEKIVGAFIRENVADDAAGLYTDDATWYRDLDDSPEHKVVRHSLEEWVVGDVHSNGIEGVWPLFKRSIVGSYHQLSAKHLPAYLDEFEFRFNNRKNPYLFRDTLLALIRGERLTYETLTAGGAKAQS